jgi:hypothetical protein
MKRYAVLAPVFALAIHACQAEDLGPTGGTGAVTGGTAAPSGGTGGAGAGATGGNGGTLDTPAGEGGGGAGGTGGGGGSAPMCVNQGEINFDCPFNLPPIMGSCAPHGACCQRASNVAKVAALGPDEPAVFEYRLNYVDIINHPFSIGLPDLQRTANQRADVCAGEQCLLWRFTQPRQGGALVAGMGEAEIGVGAYNCDGSFSFYGPSAAPDRSADVGESEPGRWQSVKVPAAYDPSKEGVESFHIPWATNKNRQTARSIFLFPSDNSIDWELASAGFEITDIDTTEAGWDCMGTREGFGWGTRAGFVAYSPMKGNDKDISNQISQTYCALLGFGLLPEGAKDKDCLTTERCLPDDGAFGDGGCDWVKLPDSLCPETPEQEAIFGCHLGAEGNPNKETDYSATLHCTPEEPTAALDPDMGATSLGQCCDPLGASTTLPACNAYRTVGKFVAAAAEITDEPRANLPPVCE